MLGIRELKGHIEITQTTVECPVKDCSEKVERQREVFRREERFKCPKHSIYISPSTFEYLRESDNILWKDQADLALFRQIKKVKRESRIARDNSEDAVSWNVFRFLERTDLLEGFLSSISGKSQKSPELTFWSYSPKENTSWSELNKARKEFGEEIKRSSEPDIITKADNALFFIEAKLTAGNETVPSDKSNSKKYEAGGERWFSKVFKSDYKTVATVERKYELMRFWLLGTWMAKQQDLDFCLVNLVLSEREKDIERLFRKHIKEDGRRRFVRAAWEDIYGYILNSSFSGKDKKTMLDYFKNKTIGYDRDGKLQRAFSIP